MKSRFIALTIAGLIMGLSGCKPEPIQTYWTGKEAPFAASDSAGISWSLPEGWIPAKTSGLVRHRFQIPSAGQPFAEMTIVKLGPEAGAILPNLNRWRRQIGLPPVSDPTPFIKPVSGLNAEAIQFDIVSGNSNTDPRFLVTMMEQGSDIWFFKLTGTHPQIRQLKPTYHQFIQSVKIQK